MSNRAGGVDAQAKATSTFVAHMCSRSNAVIPRKLVLVLQLTIAAPQPCSDGVSQKHYHEPATSPDHFQKNPLRRQCSSMRALFVLQVCDQEHVFLFCRLDEVQCKPDSSPVQQF